MTSKKLIEEMADKYDVTIEWLDHDGYGRNGASVSGEDIMLKPSDADWMYEIGFWHELGHILLKRSMNGRSHYMSKLSCEGCAWELGFSEAAKHDREWDYQSDQMEWARKQLASYVNGEYDDTKKHYDV